MTATEELEIETDAKQQTALEARRKRNLENLEKARTALKEKRLAAKVSGVPFISKRKARNACNLAPAGADRVLKPLEKPVGILADLMHLIEKSGV